MKDFKEQLAEILEVETVKETDELMAFESWDSLTILSIIALVDESYGVPMSSEQIKETLTIGGLVSYVEQQGRLQTN